MDSNQTQMKTCINEEEDHAQYAMQLATASVLPMVLKATVELGVLEILHKAGPEAQLSVQQIASQIPGNSNPDAPYMLDFILKLLASHSIITCSVAATDDDKNVGNVERVYGLAPVAKYFVKKENGGSLTPMLLLFQDKFFMDNWYNFKDNVLNQVPTKMAHEMTPLETMKNDPRLLEMLAQYSAQFNPLFMEKFLEIYKGFGGIKTLVDVGGGNGSVLNMIISKYPHIKGINYDVPAVIEKSPSYPNIEHIPGDMFDSVPKGDAIFIKWVLHGWDDKKCVKVLRSCYEALPADGKVLVAEIVLPEHPETNAAAKSVFQFCTSMMNTVRGRRKERTEREWANLGKEAGFSVIRVACCAYDCSVVEFCKNV